ncbi:MAG: phosphoribosylamine--glycine ligase [Candidatus Margulisiibacteriota bacterium]|jgi:phosphoribosylamine--glycine ligase
MKVLLIGSGGREHSLALKIAKSPLLTKLYIAPGNPGTANLGENIPIKINEYEKLIEFVKREQIDLTFVGPELPLTEGIADIFESAGLTVIGPNKAGAKLESSKEWAKGLMKKYHVPTANFEVFEDYLKAVEYLKTKNTFPIVIKANGLAQGKGVSVAQNFAEAENALKNAMIEKVFQEAGTKVVIEDFLRGYEVSVLAFTDGETILPLAPAQDHKAIFDYDLGPNTGGMGAYSPVKSVGQALSQKIMEKVLKPMISALKSEGIIYKGILYAGLMIENNEPYVIEFNVRFGDPETQVILPRLETDLLEVFDAIKHNNLKKIELTWKSDACVSVVLAANGYPDKYETNQKITINPDFERDSNLQLIYAGTALDQDQNLVTNGGRVLNIVALGQDLKSAIAKAYQGINLVHFENMYFRKDIGQKGL